MPQILVRDIPDSVMEKLDEIVKAQGYASRNALVNDILAEYVAVGDKMFLDALPPIIRTICSTEIKILNEQSQLATDVVTQAAKRLIYTLEKLEVVLTDKYIAEITDNE